MNIYRDMTPSLARIESVLLLDKYAYSPDHVAFRTFRHAGGIGIFRPFLLHNGYLEMDSYEFPTKKLHARWFKPPTPELPRFFISEIKDESLSRAAQQVIFDNLTDDHFQLLHTKRPDELDVMPYPIAADELEFLRRESEYAAWTIIHGNRVNHIAINVADIRAGGDERDGWVESIEQVVDLLGMHGFQMLTTGTPLAAGSVGLVAGSSLVPPAAGKRVINTSRDGLLAQASVMADPFRILLRPDKSECGAAATKRTTVGGGFVEFIERKKGREGFEPENALNIFNSTNVGAKV